ncbi:MAG: ATP-binding protein [Actinomycetota bacterium]|nr:ATP-binding protein [Actinomycetota bacterium]
MERKRSKSSRGDSERRRRTGRPSRRLIEVRRYPVGSLSRNLFGSIGILMITALLTGVSGLTATVIAAISAHDAISQIAPLDKANAEMQLEQLNIQASAQGYVLTSSPSLLWQSEVALAQYGADYRRASALAAGDPAIGRNIQAQNAVVQQWIARYVQPNIQAKNHLRALTHVAGSGRPLIRKFQELNHSAANMIRRKRLVPQKRLVDAVWAAAVLSLTLTSTGTLMLLRRGRKLHERIALPLEHLIQALHRIEAGDLAVRVEVGGPSEIRAVGNAVNTMAARVAQLDAEQSEQLKTEQFLRRLGRNLRAEATTGDVARRGLDSIGPLLAADRAGVYVLGGELPEMLSSEWTRSGELAPLGAGLEVLLSVVEEAGIELWLGEPFLVGDVARSAALEQPARLSLGSIGITSFAAAPVPVGEDTLAVLWIALAGGLRDWSKQDVRALGGAARELGTALSTARLYEQVHAMMLKRAELDRTQREFVSTVSHELRTPLTSIVGYLDLLREDVEEHPLDDEQLRMLDVVQRNTQRLLGLIEDILLISKVDCGTVAPVAKSVSLEGVIASVMEAMRPLAGSRSLSLVDCLSTPLDTVTGDPRQLERVLLNVVSNAIKFSPAGGTVEIGAANREGPEVMIWVADSGIGIPTDEQDRLFTRFFRSTNTQREEIGGTGLGLAIVKNLVEIHGGRIQVKSEVGRGTRVEVILPAQSSSPLGISA